MTVATMLALQDQAFTAPSYFMPVSVALFILGALTWLVAAALGLTRARVFGASARWFALAAVCLVLHHLWFIGLALGIVNRSDLVLSIGAFFNLFVLLGGVCAVIGFTRLTNPRP